MWFPPVHPENLEETLMFEMKNNVAKKKHHSVPEYIKIPLGLTINKQPLSQELLTTGFPLPTNSVAVTAIFFSGSATAATTRNGSIIHFIFYEPYMYEANDRPAIETLVVAIKAYYNNETILGIWLFRYTQILP